MNKINDPININVNINDKVHNQSVIYAACTLLKYLLYQRRQIPIPFDSLRKDIEKRCKQSPTVSPSEAEEVPLTNGSSAAAARMRHMQFIQQKKKRAKEQKTLDLYTKKGAEFLKQFDEFEKAFEDKMATEGDKVKAVRFAIGTNIINAKEMYTVNVNDNLEVNGCKPFIKDAKNRINDAFFRSFIGDEKVSNIVSKQCPLQQIWLLILMNSDEPMSDQESRLSSIPAQFQVNRSAEISWVPRPSYKSSSSASHINMTLKSTLPSSPPEENKKSSSRQFSSLSKSSKMLRTDSDISLDDSLLDEFEFGPLNSTDEEDPSSPEDKFIRPQNPTPISASRQSKLNLSSEFEDDFEPFAMEVTPVVKNGSTERYNCALATPNNSYYMNTDSSKTCTKVLAMVETPITTSNCSSFSKFTSESAFENTPRNQTSSLNSRTCYKVKAMEETPVVTSKRSLQSSLFNTTDCAKKACTDRTEEESVASKQNNFTRRLNNCLPNGEENKTVWYQLSVPLKGFLDCPVPATDGCDIDLGI